MVSLCRQLMPVKDKLLSPRFFMYLFWVWGLNWADCLNKKDDYDTTSPTADAPSILPLSVHSPCRIAQSGLWRGKGAYTAARQGLSGKKRWRVALGVSRKGVPPSRESDQNHDGAPGSGDGAPGQGCRHQSGSGSGDRI